MQADQIATYFPLVEVMNRVDNVKVLWVLTILLIAALVRIYFLSARVRKLEGCEPEPNATGWVRPTRRLIQEVPSRVMRAAIHGPRRYSVNMLSAIQPWTTESIAALSVYMQQSVSIAEIATQRRLATVSAIVHGFAIPADMMLLDEQAVALYLDYRSRVSPALGSVELMQYAHVDSEEPVDEARLTHLVASLVPVVGLLLKYAEREAWPVFDVFARDLMLKFLLERHEIKSIVTAYSAYSKMLVPSEYVLNNALAFCLYRRVSSMQLFEETGAPEGEGGVPTLV